MIIVFEMLQRPLCPGRKRSSRTVSGDPANHASTSRVPEPALRAEADTGPVPHSSPTEDADMLSSTNSEVESAMNHRHRRAILRNNIFSEEAFNAFNSGDAYIRAAQGGLARATDQYTKDIRVRNLNKHV